MFGKKIKNFNTTYIKNPAAFSEYDYRLSSSFIIGNAFKNITIKIFKVYHAPIYTHRKLFRSVLDTNFTLDTFLLNSTSANLLSVILK